MKKVLLAVLLPLFVFFLLSSPSIAQHGNMAAEKQPVMKMASTDVVADGLVVTFMVMPNSNHKNMLKNMKMADDIEPGSTHNIMVLSLIHISEPTRLGMISYALFCLKKTKCK